MNNGAFGENFPYSNFHDLNTDWLIKIAKDFLDQYTHLQETIETGLNDLQEKADTLESLLQEWYDTHSEDIADQLANALTDLNNWYTTHQNYLDQTLIDNEQALDTFAEAKLAQTLASIPSDYTALSDKVANNIIDLSSIETITTGGVTFTKHGETSISATGTAVRNILLNVASQVTGLEEVIIKGGADGGAANTYFYGIYEDVAGTRVAYVTNSTDVVKVTLDPSLAYNIRIVILNGKTVSNAVFTPKLYNKGFVFDLDNRIDENALNIKKAELAYRQFEGSVFITECGDSIFVETVKYRLYNKKTNTYTAQNTSVSILAGGYSSVNYIIYDGTTFSRSTEINELAIAYVGDKHVIPLIDGNIICDYRKIQNGYIRDNSKYYLNFNRTPIKAICQYESPNIKISERGYIFTSPQTVTYNFNDISATFTITRNNSNIANKKILAIGDSFLARGDLLNWLHEFEPTLQFIGTKLTATYSYRCEAVSGSRLYYFTNPDTSPFYFNGSLNFSQYLSANNLTAPDYVIINSGINHVTYKNSEYGSFLQNLKALVNMIHSYNANIKIYVTFCANYAITPPSSYGYPSLRYQEVRKCGNSVYDVSGITIVPFDTALIDELDYPTINTQYFNKTVPILSDCVHPSVETGFRKLAEMMYNYLGV